MKQYSAPEAHNLINGEIGMCASFRSEEGHCVGVFSPFYLLCL